MRRTAVVGAWLPALALCAGAALAAEDCLPPGDTAGVLRLESKRVALAARPVPAPIVAGRMFALEVAVCRGSVRSLRVDAQMPAHRHGMNYMPEVYRRGGLWRAEGLMFHMPGHWQLNFEVDTGAGRERLTQDLSVE